MILKQRKSNPVLPLLLLPLPLRCTLLHLIVGEERKMSFLQHLSMEVRKIHVT